MARFQRGHIFEAFGAFHVRYYVTELVDGKPVRKQKSERLCANDARHKLECNKRGKCSPDAVKEKKPAWCRPVQRLADEVMDRVNKLSGTPDPDASEDDLKIVDFWKQTYLPHLEAEVKASTLNGYTKIWKGVLSKEFGEKTLKEYQTKMGTIFLTDLAMGKVTGRKCGTRTVAHVKSLARAMFAHSAAIGLIENNPWHDAKSLSKTKSGKTHAYTLEEAETIVNALVDDPASQLLFSLACFMGLRPGEIEALKWSDVSDGWLHVRRASWRGIVGTTKTEESVASLPLIEPIASMVSVWRAKSGNPIDGYMFPSNRRDENGELKPMIIHGLVKRDIIPVLEKKGVAWHGLYSGRRGCATLLTQLTGDAVAAQYVL
ncbi:MAG: site-specific integrase, partial [Terriglobales bacterium]